MAWRRVGPVLVDAVRLAVGVVGHTSRVAEAKLLTRMVRADFLSVDNGVMGCDANHQLVQRHLSALPADWCVVLEDDAVVSPSWRFQVCAALEVAPEPVVSLYLGRQRPPQYQRQVVQAVAKANTADASWIVGRRMLHAVGYAVRADLMASLNDFDSGLPADERLSAWCSSVAYCWPSLCDHADLPTVVAHRDGQPRVPGRTAYRVGVRDVWTERAVPLGA